APMMAWTDRHCRRLHRCYAAKAELFTEMVTTDALAYGDADALLRCHPDSGPVTVQLGGCDPEGYARAAERVAAAGFARLNINVGCPSDRVQHARIGACLMREPATVAACAEAARGAGLPVSVKCRLGLDGDDTDDFVIQFIDRVAAAGVSEFYLHARIAILRGLSPAQNRQVPPLQYDRLQRLRARYPTLTLHANGGIDSVAVARSRLRETGCDGVMIGRAAYQNPWLLAELEAAWRHTPLPDGPLAPLPPYLDYVREQLAGGERLHALTRHLHGIARGLPGARAFRRHLSEYANRPDAGMTVLEDALGYLGQPIPRSGRAA
ncbi:MAG: tRNA dihydrouridine(20/20a) synthase DusA, partial [Pseudomonadota bacterium]